MKTYRVARQAANSDFAEIEAESPYEAKEKFAYQRDAVFEPTELSATAIDNLWIDCGGEG